MQARLRPFAMATLMAGFERGAVSGVIMLNCFMILCSKYADLHVEVYSQGFLDRPVGSW